MCEYWIVNALLLLVLNLFSSFGDVPFIAMVCILLATRYRCRWCDIIIYVYISSRIHTQWNIVLFSYVYWVAMVSYCICGNDGVFMPTKCDIDKFLLISFSFRFSICFVSLIETIYILAPFFFSSEIICLFFILCNK